MIKLNAKVIILTVLTLISCNEKSKDQASEETKEIAKSKVDTIPSSNVKNDNIISQWARWRKRSGCDVRGGGCMIAISSEEAKSLRDNEKSTILFNLLNDSTLLASYTNIVNGEGEDFMFFSKNTSLTPEICNLLNKKEIVIINGEYRVDFRKNKFGSSTLKVISN